MNIGICGISRSGKSILANKISGILPGQSVIFDLDDYMLPVEQLDLIHALPDWENENCLDLPKLEHDIHKFQGEHLIVEGIFTLSELLSNIVEFDKRFFLHIPYSEYVHKRLQETRWGNEPRWYIEYVWTYFHSKSEDWNLDGVHHLNGLAIPDASELTKLLS